MVLFETEPLESVVVGMDLVGLPSLLLCKRTPDTACGG